jgi:hypothetical protein
MSLRNQVRTSLVVGQPNFKDSVIIFSRTNSHDYLIGIKIIPSGNMLFSVTFWIA